MATVRKKSPSAKVRYAVVGLTWISQARVLPAFANAADNSELAALVSGDPEKRERLGKHYGVSRTCSYHEFDFLVASGDIDAVYIALPNHLHHDFTVRAARAGVHVLCEKPMAVTVAECEDMIRTCQENGVHLMIAYRLHFEESNLRAIEVVRSGMLGDVRVFDSVVSQQVVEPNVRLRKAYGGGPLLDMGVYCINAARYLFQDEPVEVVALTARKPEERFREVEEMAAALLRFPHERLATFVCSFGGAPVSTCQVVGTQGSLRLDPAFEIDAELKHFLTVKGETREQTFARRDQFAPELLYFSDCILKNQSPEPDGFEGLIDVQVVEAIYRSANSGQPVKLALPPRHHRPHIGQEIRRPPIQVPELFHVHPPSGGGG